MGIHGSRSNPYRVPGKLNENVKRYTKKVRKELLIFLGGKCSRCGFSDERALQIDHINGGGVKELRKINGASYYRRVILSLQNGEGKYQLLCANCNWIKRVENREITSREKNVGNAL